MVINQKISIVLTYSKEVFESLGLSAVTLQFKPHKAYSNENTTYLYPTIMGVGLEHPHHLDMTGGDMQNSNRVFLFSSEERMLENIQKNWYVWLVMRARDVEHLEGLPEGDPYLGVIVEQRLLSGIKAHYRGAPYCTNLQGDPTAWKKPPRQLLRGNCGNEVTLSSKEAHGLEGGLFPLVVDMVVDTRISIGVKPAVSCDKVYLVNQDGVYKDSSVLAHCPHAALHFAGGCHPGCNLCGEHVVLGINIRDQYTKEKEG